MTSEAVRPQFAWAASIPSEIDRLLPTLVPVGPVGAEEVAAFQDFVVRVDHVGFVASGSPNEVCEVGESLGWIPDPTWSTSTVIARELATRCGRDEVETVIVRFERAADDADVVPGIEVFLPTDVDAAIVDGWVASGTGRHVALAVSGGHELAAASALESWGYRRPSFLRDLDRGDGRPPVVYLDHPSPTTIGRVEICRR